MEGNVLGGIFTRTPQPEGGIRGAVRGFGNFLQDIGNAGLRQPFRREEQEQQLDEQRKKAMAQDAFTVYGLLNDNKVDDALSLIDRRVQYINELGGDPSDTLQLRDMIASGQTDIARQELGSFVTAAMENGYLPQDELLKTEGGQAIFKTPQGGVKATAIPGYNPDLVGGSGSPADVQSFEAMAAAGNLTPEQRAQAAQIRLGLSPRAAGGGQQIRMIRGADGVERPSRFSQQTGQLEIFDGQSWVIAGDSDQASGIAQMLQMGEQYPIPEGVPESAAQITNRSPLSAGGLFIGRSPEEQAQLTAEATPPPGYRFNERGEAVPIVGGPVWREDLATERAKSQRQETLRQRGGTVLRDVQRALERADTAGPVAGTIAETRTGQGLTRQLGAALSPAYELAQHLDSIKSNISIDQLQQMRESSPTGGALGQVPVQQQEFLMQVLGALNPRLSPEVLRENLKAVYNIYLDAIYGSPNEIAEAVRDGRMTEEMADLLTDEREEVPFSEFGRRLGFSEPAPEQDDQGRYIIESDEDYESIPSGAIFIAPDGVARRKP
jgi:hypothetical protein